MHPSALREPPAGRSTRGRLSRPVEIPRGEPSAHLRFGSRTVTLTNLDKPFWPSDIT
jgi:hypothetical protein